MDFVLPLAIGFGAFAGILLSMVTWQPMALAILLSSVTELHLRLELGVRVGDTMTLLPPDVLFPIAAIAAALRLLMLRRSADIGTAWVVCAIVMLLGFFHGVMSYGIIDAAIGYRQFFYLSAGIVYFSTFDYRTNEQRAVMAMMVASGLFLTAAACVFWLMPGSSPVTASFVRNVFEEYRILPAIAAMFLNLTFLLTLPSWSMPEHGALRRACAPLFFLVVLVLYHRTAWVALVAAMVVLIMLSRRRIAMHLMALVTAGIIFLSVWAIMAGIESDIFSAPMTSAFTEVSQDDSSLAWRMIGWKALTARSFDEGLSTVLFGAGFGVGFERRIGWGTVTVAPHNMYLEVFLTCGLVGVAAYLLPFLAMAARLRRLASQDGSGVSHGAAFTATVVSIIVYGFSYGHHYDIALLVGMLASLAAKLTTARAQTR